MEKTELLKLKEQLEKEYAEVRENFLEYCKSNECTLMEYLSKDNKNILFSELLDGEQYDELEEEIPQMFYFSGGKAHDRFDIYRAKGGMLNQLILKINDLLGEELDDDYWWDEYTWGKEGLERKIEESKKVIAEENAFIDFIGKSLKILEELSE